MDKVDISLRRGYNRGMSNLLKGLCARVYAKLNLGLCVGAIRQDGRHSLYGVNTSISLFDTVTVLPAGDYEVSYVGTDLRFEQDSALLTARMFAAGHNLSPVSISIDKHIWLESGLGGSCADAVGVAAILSHLYGLDDVGAVDEYYSDARFLRTGGIAKISGTGSEICPLSYRKYHFLIVRPRGGVNTARCYAAFDSLGRMGCRERVDELVSAVENGDDISSLCFNDLTEAAESLCPAICSVRRYFAENGIALTMTGSGSALYSVLENDADISYLTSLCVEAERAGVISHFAFCHSVPRGVEIVQID